MGRRCNIAVISGHPKRKMEKFRVNIKPKNKIPYHTCCKHSRFLAYCTQISSPDALDVKHDGKSQPNKIRLNVDFP